jgi:hypothetical protein
MSELSKKLSSFSPEFSLQDKHFTIFMIHFAFDLKKDATKIIQAATSKPWMGTTYRRLAQMVDTFGPRIVGSTNLENAIGILKFGS